jgi:hypothetical protein
MLLKAIGHQGKMREESDVVSVAAKTIKTETWISVRISVFHTYPLYIGSKVDLTTVDCLRREACCLICACIIYVYDVYFMCCGSACRQTGRGYPYGCHTPRMMDATGILVPNTCCCIRISSMMFYKKQTPTTL